MKTSASEYKMHVFFIDKSFILTNKSEYKGFLRKKILLLVCLIKKFFQQNFLKKLFYKNNSFNFLND